jgi:hypothetical protein
VYELREKDLKTSYFQVFSDEKSLRILPNGTIRCSVEFFLTNRDGEQSSA